MDKRECKDCPYILNIQDDVRELKDDINRLYQVATENSKSISGIVTASKVLFAIVTVALTVVAIIMGETII